MNLIRIYWTLVKEAIFFFRKNVRYNASIKTNGDLQKMQYAILRENHVIEKGMSMHSPRQGFGQTKIKILLDKLELYANKYCKRDLSFLLYPLSTIQNYIIYTKERGTLIPDIEKQYNSFVHRLNLKMEELDYESGIVLKSKAEIVSSMSIPYEQFVNSRHSIRYFSPDIPDLKIIHKALQIAQRTPSACNRQAWMAHIFYGKKCQDLLNWQGGAKGFEKEIPMAILVTANQKAFFSYETHQAYIDGGMYAMSLIYALHSQQLGTIPLSCGFSTSHLSVLSKYFDIPEYEIPIVIIGVGVLLDYFNVAVSSRKNINHTTVVHH